MAATYQFGIEEELFLADARTRGTPRRVKRFHEDIHERIPEVERELLVSQVEIMTPLAPTLQQRAPLSGICGRGWRKSAARMAEPDQKERYNAIADDMQMLARRDVVCGMHVASSPFWQRQETGLSA